MIKNLWAKYPLISILTVVGVTLWANSFLSSHKNHQKHDHSLSNQAIADIKWICSMHPQVIADKKGLCPLCGMDLIPLELNKNSQEIRTLELSQSAAKLADIQTTPVKRMKVSKSVRLAGKVVYDESRIKTITARVPGRIDKLYADFTGIQVRKGEHLFDVYSPELLSAQQELIQAVKAYKNLDAQATTILKKTILSNLESIRNKLRLWGIKDKQIKQIEESFSPSDHITIYAPIGGTIIHKNAEIGKYLKTGTPVYKIADLTHVWLELEAYESDLPWLHYGQKVSFTTMGLPGNTFEGTVVFIDPVLNDKTRSVNIRVNVNNKDGLLKPGMFVSAIVKSDLAADGRILPISLQDKWICPMHGEIIKDSKGICDICSMDLELAESLGFKTISDKNLPLVIPQSAPLLTGKRAIVYVQLKEDPLTFESREITLGAKADGYYIVSSGLNENERVVTSGNFKIDSAMQIVAKPSMMNKPKKSLPEGSHHEGSHHEDCHQEGSGSH